MRKILSFVLLVYTQNLWSQPALPMVFRDKYQVGGNESRIEVMPNKDTVFITKFNYRNPNTTSIDEVEMVYLGTPLFQNAWYNNSIIYVDGAATKGNAAFNLTSSEVLFSAKDIANPVKVKPDSFLVAGHLFIHLQKKNILALNTYYEQIFKSPKNVLYKSYKCVYKPNAIHQQTGYDVLKNDYEGSFIKSYEFHYTENEQLIELRRNSSIFKAFGDRKNDVEKYAKKNNLNPKNEKDLVEIFKYYVSQKL